ncbi:hypothetical protein FRC01_010795 [Tulasnella sp. 417]|nr:hypothetical protein FRC01_010795 [Tulasnella sp. 417]
MVKKWQRPSSTAIPPPPINETEGFKRAATVFAQATNITDLSFTNCSAWTSNPLYEPIKHAVANMSLKRLTIWNCQGLFEVLRDQPELEELKLGGNCSGIEKLENTDVPKLRSLSARLENAAYLVPGRPVERLKLDTPFGSPGSDRGLFDRLSLSTKPIVDVSVALHNAWDEEGVRLAIRAFARNWPETERLVISVTGPITRKTILDEMPAFQSIRELAFLDARLTTAEEGASVDPTHNYGIVPQGASEDWEQVFSHLKELCPKLVKTSYTEYVDAAGMDYDRRREATICLGDRKSASKSLSHFPWAGPDLYGLITLGHSGFRIVDLGNRIYENFTQYRCSLLAAASTNTKATRALALVLRLTSLAMTKPNGNRLWGVPNIWNPKSRTEKVETPRTNPTVREAPLKCQENSLFAQIPEDIIFLIVAYLNETSQARLLRTCRYFQHIIEASLYRHIIPIFPWRYDRSDLLFRTLLERQDLLPYISTYKGVLIPSVITPPQKPRFLDIVKKRQRSSPKALDPPPINETEGFKKAVTLFTQAANIADLNFTDCSAWTSDPLYEPIKHAVAKMSLKRLTLWNCQGLAEVLRDQPELEELKLGGNCSGIEKLENKDLPKLRSLSARLENAAYLVPGRPVERLELDTPLGLPGSDRGLVDRLSLSTKPVVDVSVALHNAWDEEGVRLAIRAFARNWPETERLVISVTGPITRKTILDEMPVFQCIRELAFLDARLTTAEESASADPYGIVPDGSSEDWEQVFSSLKELCPKLVKTSYTSYITSSCYGLPM